MEASPSTRDHIIQGARVVFAEKGFRASMRDIARAAGISTTSLIFWYFKDKEALFLAVVEDSSPLSQAQQLLTAMSNTVSSADIIRHLVHVYYNVYGDPLNRQILFQMLSHTTWHPKISTLLKTQLSDVTAGRMVAVIVAGQNSGEFRRDLAPDFAAQAVLGILFALVTRWHVDGHSPWPEQEVADDILTMLGYQIQDPSE
ncbi:MAG: TetR/AcrR family transcriptional regulator [Sulfobacillus benefaciens]|uniref:TetR/AcrR family transcriptional regulator n=1 Tax=Sulfobacillus benefaciens TaxID=453960 RepID=A0A2T2XG61_9FIRM|nr:MAG: TetR/AcrR family transcriptional regulator [Sulfobacillus benefaciens]